VSTTKSTRSRILAVLVVLVTLCTLALLRNERLWSQPRRRLHVVIAIISRPQDVYLRNSMRSTFLKRAAGGLDKVDHVFYVGDEVTEIEARVLGAELRRWSDIRLLSRVGNDMAAQTALLLAACENLDSQYHFSLSKPDYVVLLGANVYVRLQALLEHLRTQSPTKLFMGRTSGVKTPFRDQSSPYYVGFTEYQFKYYPPHLHSSAIALSWDLVKPIGQCVPDDVRCYKAGYASCRIPDCCRFQPLRFPDVTLGGIALSAITGHLRFDLSCNAESNCTKYVTTLYQQFSLSNKFLEKQADKTMCHREFFTFAGANEVEMRTYHTALSANDQNYPYILDRLCGRASK